MDINKFIQENTPFVFAKFGDGEYYAAKKCTGGNCDGTPYTQKLGDGVIESFKYLTSLSNVFIGKWDDFKGVADYFESLTGNSVNWENYNILIPKSPSEFLNRTLSYFKTIRNAKQQKIYVCNPAMVRESREILKIDRHVPVHPTNWFEQNYDSVLQSVINSVETPDNVIIMTSAGMGAKVLIADLRKKFPNAIIIDIGSALDLVCSNRKTRNFHHAFTPKDIETIKKAIV